MTDRHTEAITIKRNLFGQPRLTPPGVADEPRVRRFDSGATRDQDVNKFDYEAFLSPIVLERYAAYMHKNRFQSDGSLRAGDNWQKGIPLEAYMKSLARHYMELWKHYRNFGTIDEEAACAMLFNTMGGLFEQLMGRVEGHDRVFPEPSVAQAPSSTQENVAHAG